MRVLDSPGLDFDDVLIVPQRSEGRSRSVVDLNRSFKGKHSTTTFGCVPIIASNMYATGSIKMAYALEKHRIMTALHKHQDILEENKFITREKTAYNDVTFLTIGESLYDLDRIKILPLENRSTILINIDVANGYRSSFVEFIKKVRPKFPRSIIMAGNVCTPEMTQELILAGADIVKVGIGPGSVCETRNVTGVGYPQLSAIIECANAAHCLGGYICADGGCRTSGDVCKAFGAGADFVMLGGMLAGTDECDGEWSYIGNKRYKYLDPNSIIAGTQCFVEGGITGISMDGTGCAVCTFDKSKDGLIEYGEKQNLKFYGMSSREAMINHGGVDKEYRASEGKCITVSYKGPVENVINEILGGLRSCGTYIGAMEIKHFPKCATFIKFNRKINA